MSTEKGGVIIQREGGPCPPLSLMEPQYPEHILRSHLGTTIYYVVQNQSISGACNGEICCNTYRVIQCLGQVFDTNPSLVSWPLPVFQ